MLIEQIIELQLRGLGPSSVRRILKKGGGGQKNQKIWEEQRSEWKFFHPKSVPFSCPKSVEDHKKKVFSQIQSDFLAKIRWRPKKKVFAQI